MNSPFPNRPALRWLDTLAREPYRIFFPLGFLASAVGVMLWPALFRQQRTNHDFNFWVDNLLGRRAPREACQRDDAEDRRLEDTLHCLCHFYRGPIALAALYCWS